MSSMPPTPVGRLKASLYKPLYVQRRFECAVNPFHKYVPFILNVYILMIKDCDVITALKVNQCLLLKRLLVTYACQTYLYVREFKVIVLYEPLTLHFRCYSVSLNKDFSFHHKLIEGLFTIQEHLKGRTSFIIIIPHRTVFPAVSETKT